MKKQTILTVFSILMALVSVVACQFTIPQLAITPAPTFATKFDIPFENVALNEWGVNDKMSQEPQLFVLMRANDVVKIQSFISDKALQEVQKLSWDEYAVIAVFRGVQGCSLFGVGVESLIIEGDTLFVNAQFWQPPPNFICQAVLTSPYHLVKVRKAGAMLNRLKPVLLSRTVEKGNGSDQEKIGTE